MINKLKWTKKARIVAAVLCIALATASILVFTLMDKAAEAAILTPIESPPEIIFYDDFSGDLSQWTEISGLWTIEMEELNGTGTGDQNFILAGNSEWVNYVVEARFKILSPHWDAGISVRVQDDSNMYLVALRSQSFPGSPKIRLYKRVAGTFTSLAYADPTISDHSWHTVKVSVMDEGAGVRFKIYVDDSAEINFLENSKTFSSGKIGLRVYGSTEAHFDDVAVTTPGYEVPGAYNMRVRAGATNIVVTCTWAGSGNITIENMTSPTTTYYESDMSIYEKSTVSFDGTSTSIFNVRRASLSITATASTETWTLYLEISDVRSYQVSVEIS